MEGSFSRLFKFISSYRSDKRFIKIKIICYSQSKIIPGDKFPTADIIDAVLFIFEYFIYCLNKVIDIGWVIYLVGNNSYWSSLFHGSYYPSHKIRTVAGNSI